NEVVANRANEILGHALGEKGPIHPNDHVNMGQSSNDVIPTAIHVAALMEIDHNLLPALRELEESLAKKAKEFDPIVKSGRTHLMDATPIRLGQEFSGYQSQIDHGIRRVSSCRAALAELAIGGTAVGTGINAHLEFPGRVVEKISAATDTKFRVAENHFEAQASQDALVEASGAIRAVAVSTIKIANDPRVFAHRCIEGISANIDVLQRYAESSPAIATTLNLLIGYEKAAEIAKESGRTGKTVKQLVIEKGILSAEEAEKVLDPRHLTSPSKDLLGGGGG